MNILWRRDTAQNDLCSPRRRDVVGDIPHRCDGIVPVAIAALCTGVNVCVVAVGAVREATLRHCGATRCMILGCTGVIPR